MSTEELPLNPALEIPTPAASEGITTETQDVKPPLEERQSSEEQPLESHEVIELQTFSERKAWIEDKIKFLESLPPVEVFVGLDSIRSSAEVVTGLPTRAELEKWIAEHDMIEKETEIFDTGELTKLRQLTKAATQRNLSPEDTDVIELTLTTIYALDKLLHLLRDRSENLELLGIRLTWEEHRSAAWAERRQLVNDLKHFVENRARWNTSIYKTLSMEDRSLSRRGSINSFASAGSDLSVTSAAFSRSARFKLAEVLSRDAAQFASRVSALRHGTIASAGKTLDKLIDNSRKPVPEELLDEQDRLEENGINELDQVGKFAMNLVMQWRKADEIHVETVKDQVTAQNLLEEIETAKMHHPTQRQSLSFVSRADALLKRLSLRVNPVTNPAFFPYPAHPLFEDQKGFNNELAQELAFEINVAMELVQKVNNAAKAYQTMFDAVKRLDTVLEDAIDTSADFKTYIKRMEIGVPSKDGDGYAPNLSTERCLDATRHAVFIAFWPSLSDNIMDAVKRTEQILAEAQIAFALFDASGVRDPEYRTQGLAEIQQLKALKEQTETTRAQTIAKLDTLREGRKIASNVDAIQQRLGELRQQVVEAMEEVRWRQDSFGGNLPLTPESSSSEIQEPTNCLPIDFSVPLEDIRRSMVDDIDKPYSSLLEAIEIPLRNHLTKIIAALKASSSACEEMINILGALQKQTAAMNTVREEFHTLQLRIEDAKIHSGSVVDSVLSEAAAGEHAIDDVAELHREVDSIQADVASFTEGLTFRIPFVARQVPSPSTRNQKQRSLSLAGESNLSFLNAHESQFDLLSVDGAVRADCNSFTMRLGGEVDSLVKCKYHLTLAHLCKTLDKELSTTVSQLYDATQELNGWKLKKEQLTTTEDRLLELLNGLHRTVNDYSSQCRKVVNHRISHHREALREMETTSATLDHSIRESLYTSRIRAVDDAELRFNTWHENLAIFKSELDQAIHAERFRLGELERAEEQRQRQEAERRAAEEEKRRKQEEERRLREEAERAETARMAEEARIQMEQQRLVEIEAEKSRLEREREQAERKALAEKQAAETERLRLEQHYNASIEAQRLEAQRERDELGARLRQLEEELVSTKRLKYERDQSAAEETAKTVLELEKQRQALERLVADYQQKLEALKELEKQSSQHQSTRINVDLGRAEANQDSFALEVSPVTPTPRTQENLELEARIHTLRSRLNLLGLQNISKTSVNLPTMEQVRPLRAQFMNISDENDSLPSGTDDPSANVVLRSFRLEVDAVRQQLQQAEQLAELNAKFHDCDSCLSDLLEHIDSYPLLPSVTIMSFSVPLASPEDQLSARLAYTKDSIDQLQQLIRPLLPDTRVSAENSRILQTWDELSDMVNDLIGKKSRPNSATSSCTSSSRDNASLTQPTSMGKLAHSKKSSYGSLSVSSSSKPSRGRLLEVPPRPGSQRRVLSGGTEASRSASRMSTSSGRSVSGGGAFSSTLYQPTFASRQRTTSLSSPTPPKSTPTISKRPSGNLRSIGESKRSGSPAVSEMPSTFSSNRTHATLSRSSRPSIPKNPSTWSRAPRNSLSSILPRPVTPQRKNQPPLRKKYVPNPRSKLDVAVGDVVNNLPVGINVEGLTETWKDQSGKYWIGNQDPKLCFCRILRSQTVMVRVGGGWTELSRFIKDHFADSFRLLSESPPRAGAPEEKWISSATLLETATATDSKSSPPVPPRTPEPKAPYVPSFSLLTPTGRSPQSLTTSPSTKGSPLTPLQFIRRADGAADPALLRPATPTKQPRSSNHAPLRLWRP